MKNKMETSRKIKKKIQKENGDTPILYSSDKRVYFI
jgi:hypothetical protein